MKTKKRLSTSTEKNSNFVVADQMGVIPLPKKNSPPRDLEKELFGNIEVQKIIDGFEEQMGIKNREVKAPNLLYKNTVLAPGIDEDDQDLLNDLLNDGELYRIIRHSESWTSGGQYKIFIIYSENLDVKKEREMGKLNERKES